MDIKQLTDWSTTISSVIRKTDLKLSYLHKTDPVFYDEHSRPQTSMSTYPCIDYNEPVDIASYFQKELSNTKHEIEQFVSRKNVALAKEVTQLRKRVKAVEGHCKDCNESKARKTRRFNELEEKAALEYTKLREKMRENVTNNELLRAEDSIKRNFLTHINKLELDFNELKKDNSKLKEELLHISGEAMNYELSKYIPYQDLNTFQNELLENTNRLIESFVGSTVKKVDFIVSTALSHYSSLEQELMHFQEYILQRDTWDTVEELRNSFISLKSCLEQSRNSVPSDSLLVQIDNKIQEQDEGYKSIVDKLGELEQRVHSIEANDPGTGFQLDTLDFQSEDFQLRDEGLITFEGSEELLASPKNLSGTSKVQSYYLLDEDIIKEDPNESKTEKGTPDSKTSEFNKDIEELVANILEDELEIGFETIERVVNPSDFDSSVSNFSESDVDFNDRDPHSQI